MRAKSQMSTKVNTTKDLKQINHMPDTKNIADKDLGVKQVSEREYFVHNNHFTFIDDNIIHVTPKGDINKATAGGILKLFTKLIEMIDGDVYIIIDLNAAGKPSPVAREVGRKVFENAKVNKIAFWGVHPVARIIALFMVGISQKENIRFFNTREKALEWLRRRKGHESQVAP